MSHHNIKEKIKEPVKVGKLSKEMLIPEEGFVGEWKRAGLSKEEEIDDLCKCGAQTKATDEERKSNLSVDMVCSCCGKCADDRLLPLHIKLCTECNDALTLPRSITKITMSGN